MGIDKEPGPILKFKKLPEVGTGGFSPSEYNIVKLNIGDKGFGSNVANALSLIKLSDINVSK